MEIPLAFCSDRSKFRSRFSRAHLFSKNKTVPTTMTEAAVANAPKQKKPTHNEEIKTAIPTLAGAIATTLADSAADRFSEDDAQFMKFHGIYQQDDRDLRKTGKKYIFMIR